jgi:hypothetical protein
MGKPLLIEQSRDVWVTRKIDTESRPASFGLARHDDMSYIFI